MYSNFEALRAYLRDISAMSTLQLIFSQKCERLKNDRLLSLLIYPVSVYYIYFLSLKRMFLRSDIGTTTVRKTARSCTYDHFPRIHMEHIQRQQNNIWINAEIQSPCPNNTHKSRTYALFYIIFNFFWFFFLYLNHLNSKLLPSMSMFSFWSISMLAFWTQTRILANLTELFCVCLIFFR